MSLILGVHVSQKSNVLDDKDPSEIHLAIQRDTNKLGLNAAQIFTYGPRLLVPNNINVELVKQATEDIDLTVHSAYPTTSIWTSITPKKLSLFRHQMQSCNDISAWGMVLHINKVPPELIAERMRELLPIAKQTNVKILLEMISAKSHPILTYETYEKLDRMCDYINKATDPLLHKYYGINLDTAHLWGAGNKVVQQYDTMKAYFANMKHVDKILQFHLNGSSSLLGSGMDKHEIPFSSRDLIWKDINVDNAGIRAVVEFAYERNIPIICEINRGSEQEVIKSLKTIKSYVI